MKRYQYLRQNNLIMWEGIKWNAKNGFKSISLGRTDIGDNGLLQFKRGWGVDENHINYYEYDFRSNCFVAEKSGIKPSYSLFKKLPLSILKLTGNLIYRHVG